jgi:Leucine-rich repeat (LRR) protein
VDLSWNDLASAWLQPAVWGPLVSLRHLNLSHNRITELDSGLLADMTPSLESLDLTANQVGRLSAGQFRQLGRLTSLRLDHNRVASLGQGVFHGLSASLQLLSLTNNSLGFLHDEALLPVATGIRVLRLSLNRLATLPEALHHLTQLEELDLSGNQLQQLNGSQFLLGGDGSGSQLRVLRLAGNNLEDVSWPPRGGPQPPPRLELLDLSDNRLAWLGPDSLAGLPSLSELTLSGNLLEDINGVLPSHPGLIRLDVADNRLKWFDMAFFPRQLRQLDVRGNEIEELGNYYRMVDGFQLRQLDASNNRISGLGPHTLVVGKSFFSLF